jgi:hypothetical protein
VIAEKLTGAQLRLLRKIAGRTPSTVFGNPVKAWELLPQQFPTINRLRDTGMVDWLPRGDFPFQQRYFHITENGSAALARVGGGQ